MQARRARDLGDIESLQKMIASARGQAAQKKDFASMVQLALFEDWMCEVAHGHNDDRAVKEAAEAGVEAAEQAVQMNSNSSEAHWLLGDLLGQLIPHVFGGGMRYGAQSTREVETAIQLDPKNANAYVSRGTGYYFTPAMFGGSKDKAVEMFRKAIELDPSSDAADTAHIWLAQIYDQQGKHEDALREIAAARKINPERKFAQFVYQQIASEKAK
jgi:tetratricopeptide (TPR) repeat protein